MGEKKKKNEASCRTVMVTERVAAQVEGWK